MIYFISFLSFLSVSSFILPEKRRPTFLIQYYSWWSNQYNQEDKYYEDSFVDSFDFDAIGLYGITNCSKDNSLRSKDFDYANFKFIKSIGYDALSWQIDPGTADPPVGLLNDIGLKIAPFLDIAQFAKIIINDSMTATVPDFVMTPNEQCMNLLIKNARKKFFEKVSADLYARDSKGRIIIYVFFFKWETGFSHSLSEYDSWAKKLMDSFIEILGEKPTLYINYNEGSFLLYLFQHYRDFFVPFNFVSDNTQSQYSHDSVTWNFGFDNHGVQKRDHLERVMRLDPRYITEQAWLAAATDPAAVFTYGYNEPFESSMIIPTKRWGDTKARLAKYYISNHEQNSRKLSLPKTLIIINDYSTIRDTHRHFMDLQIFFMARLFRFFAPHSDTILQNEITDELLSKYEIIIDAAMTRNEVSKETYLLEQAELNGQRVMVFNYSPQHYNDNQTSNFNEKHMIVLDSQILLNGHHHPIIVKKHNVVFVSTFRGGETKLHVAFQALYEDLIPLHKSITFLEQRVRVDPDNLKITYTQHNHTSIIGEIPMPPGIEWFRPLSGLPGDEMEKRAAEKFAYNIQSDDLLYDEKL